jgi:acyl-coenzyme A thioesterase PaaI-like protein
MERLNGLVLKAKNSKFYLWVLNLVLLRVVPFNNQHKLRVLSIGEDGVSIYASYTRKNMNHIKGVHACLLATLCEYATGLSLLLHLSPKEYRVILKEIKMTYHYQAKSNVFVRFKLDKKEIEESILNPLKTNDAVFKEFAIEVYDAKNNHICTGLINWQVKAWDKVKTKIN